MNLITSNARQFNSSLKKAITEAIGQKVKVEIINSYKFPNCWVRVHPETTFSNDFRLRVFDGCLKDRKNLLNSDDVSYGNIQSNSISALAIEWMRIFP
jgi:hypothetical protein